MLDKNSAFLIKNWYAIVIGLAVASSMAILIPSDAFPLVYLRYTLSAINLLFLPGYAFTRALFTLAEKPQTINTIERVGLSIGVSLALDAILGLILNFTPWRITVIPVGFGLTFMVVTFALAALIGEHKSTVDATL